MVQGEPGECMIYPGSLARFMSMSKIRGKAKSAPSWDQKTKFLKVRRSFDLRSVIC